jgi:[ribosomal protein S18]-alanine N-acetyltransferase
MSEEDAHTICSWKYEEPYAIYSLGNDPDEVSGMLDRRSPYYAVRDEQNELVGFFNFGTAAQPWDPGEAGHSLYTGDGMITIGLGMRPDLTGRGKGIGLAFVQAGLDFGRQQFAPKSFCLYVLSFNTRAIRVYEQAGFQRVRLFMQHNVFGNNEFMEMRQEASE